MLLQRLHSRHPWRSDSSNRAPIDVYKEVVGARPDGRLRDINDRQMMNMILMHQSAGRIEILSGRDRDQIRRHHAVNIHQGPGPFLEAA